MWRKLNLDDLDACLSESERSAFGEGDTSQADPLGRQLHTVTGMVRGMIRSGRLCPVPDDPLLIPEMLVPAALDIAAWNILKRLRIPVGEARRLAYEKATALLERVATGAIVPEPPDESSAPEASATSGAAFTPRPRALGRSREEGI